jgi:hypothetical protein
MRDLIDLVGHSLIVAMGLSTFAAASAVALEDGPTYKVCVASTDGETLVEDMPRHLARMAAARHRATRHSLSQWLQESHDPSPAADLHCR